MAKIALRGLAVPRSIVGTVSAELDPARVLDELNSAFVEFMARYDKRADALTEEIDRLNLMVAHCQLEGGASSRHRLPPITGEAAESFHAQLRGHPSAAMTTKSGPDGGFTVDPVIDGTISAVLRDISPLRSLARVVPLGEGGEWEKIVGRTGSRTAWADETEERGDTDSPTLGKVTITPHEIYALPSLTNHVLEDSSFDLSAFVQEDVSGEFALGESAAFVLGDGIKKPRGFLTYATSTDADATRDFGKIQYVPTGASGSFAAASSTVSPADVLHDLKTALRPVYRAGDSVAWLMNSTTANVIRKFKDADGRFIWTDALISGEPDRLMGYPVAIDEGMPDIGADQYAVAFGNWRRAYAIVDKPGLRLIVDRLTKKGWTKFYFSRRVGGGLVDSNALKLLKFSNS